ncbi:UNVERIFIED_CONTAM: hypothetical protein Sangu_2978800, partial [Sesamum angustifolium]
MAHTNGRVLENTEEYIHFMVRCAAEIVHCGQPWLVHQNGICMLCNDRELETHMHLFFKCRFSRACIAYCRRQVKLLWPHSDWTTCILWASRQWLGKHPVNVAYRQILASLVYHIWQERNNRRFGSIIRDPNTVAHQATNQIKARILSHPRQNIA